MPAQKQKSSTSLPAEHFVLVFLGMLGLCLLSLIGSYVLSFQQHPTDMMKEESSTLLTVFKYFCAGIGGLITGKAVK